jgi:hypothetical protein
LVVATVAVYYPVHSHPFANFDDGPYVFSNPHVRAGLSLDTVRWAFTSFGSVTPDVPDWHPLAWLSHALDTQVFGFDPAGPHDENLFLHALNVVLLFLGVAASDGIYRPQCYGGGVIRIASHQCRVCSLDFRA